MGSSGIGVATKKRTRPWLVVYYTGAGQYIESNKVDIIEVKIRSYDLERRELTS